MKGIGKKVTVAFLSVVALLAVSGFISLSELSTLSYDTDEILAASSRDVAIAKELLGAAHDHSRAMVDVAVLKKEDSRDVCFASLNTISSHISSVYSASSDEVKGCLDTLVNYGAKLQQLVEEYHSSEEEEVQTDSGDTEIRPKYTDGRKWFSENYEPAHARFVAQVKRYIDLSHSELAPRAEQLSKNAYRSVTPILISLAVMISVVLMLYYFIYIYGVKPILRMNRSLSDYLSFKLPYRTKVEMIDEVKELSDNIEHLINSSKLDIKQKKDAI